MKKLLIIILLSTIPYFGASAQGSLETSGYNCNSWLELWWIQVKRSPICVGKARCWPKGKCPNKDASCTAFHGKEEDLFCKANGEQCPDPVECIEDQSNTVKKVKHIKKR